MKKFLLLSFITCVFAQFAWGQTYIPAGNVSGTWDVGGSPYYIEGDIEIDFNDVLTIDPGVTVFFLGHYMLDVKGVLTAIGTTDEYITFTAEDAWNGIRFDFLNYQTQTNTSELIYCIIENSSKTGTTACGDPESSGGAIYVRSFSNLYISNCDIRYNSASEQGGAIGIYNTVDESLVIEESRIHNNESMGRGGAISIMDDCHPIIDNNDISYNTSYKGGGGIAIGILANGSASNPQITSNTISYNVATSTSGYGNGGGVFICGSSPYFYDNTISRNTSSAWGGGLEIKYNSSVSFYGNTIEGNVAAGNGGGMYISGSNVYLTYSTVVQQNEAMNGGGIYCSGTIPEINTSSSVNTNNASNDGGGIYLYTATSASVADDYSVWSNSADNNGGGIYVASSPDITFSDGLISSNEASNGGGIYIDNSTVALTDAIQFYVNDVDNNGGHLYATGSTLDIESSSFTYGNASGGGGINGGAMYIYNSTGSIDGATITSNQTDGSGGGLYIEDCTDPFDIFNSTISGNSTVSNGGGIYAVSCDDISIEGNTFNGNSTSSSFSLGGGAIYLYDVEESIIDDNTITNNTAARAGGGIFMQYPVDFEITNNTISDNTSTANAGGGICAILGVNGLISENTINGNDAGYLGGGICIMQITDVEVTLNEIYENTSGDHGGGISVTSSYFQIINNLIHSNYAIDKGGIEIYAALLNGTDKSLVNHNTIADNTVYDPNTGTGGVHMDAGTNLEFYNNIITYNDGYDVNMGISGSNNFISGNPVFTNGYHLTLFSSPCINAGTNSAVMTSVDLDGDARISNTTTDQGCYENWYDPDMQKIAIPDSDISNSFTTSDIGVYPNPTSDILNISMTAEEDDNIEITLYNYLGEKVYQNNNPDNRKFLSLSLKEFASGSYLVTIKAGNEVKQEKVILVK